MQRISRRMVVILLLASVGATTLVVPSLASIALGTESGPTFASSPDAGLTGTPIEASGTGCTLPETTTAGDGVIIDLHTDHGPVVASATIPVRRDGQWDGTLMVPAGTPPADYVLAARCVYPGFDEFDPVVYTARSFTVTGEGEAAPTAHGSALTAEAGSIEPLPSYDGQSTCSPTAKTGTVKFRSMVMAAFGGADYGITRACNIGGTSEHKEGRAWDWGMNANSSADRAEVGQLMTWLFATDAAGNRYAMARRLGIMYIIWNRKMFRLYDTSRGWASYSGPSPHTDHVHFSFTRAGGGGTTSFWQGDYPRPGSGGGTTTTTTTPPPTTTPPTTTPRPPTGTVRSEKVVVGGTYDAPVSGDFNGDGDADVLWYGAGSRPDYLWFGDGGAFQARAVTVRGEYQPLVGDFNGDHRDDILWYGTGANPDYLWLGQTNGSFAGRDIAIGRSYERPIVGNFNGDRYDDVLWYQPGTGFDYLWHGSAYGFAGSNIVASGEYRAFTGDFDGDRRDDIFWYGPGADLDYLWFGDVGGGFTGKGVNQTGNTTPVVGDYDDDGRDDVIWYGAGSRADGVWYGRGSRTFHAGNVTVTGNYDAPLPGDYDGNGHDDVIWYGRGAKPDYLWRY